jgi:XTP/dITP diphosphohydrolase
MDGQTPVLLASNNPHKHAELRALLEPYGFGVVTPDDLGLAVAVDETGVTFAENAVLKAEAFCAASGLPSLADDSGLVVDALGGEPGIHSARYGGPGLTDKDRTALVLTRMRSISDHERQAAFVAAVAVAVPDQPTRVFEGRVEGTLTREPAGVYGFGYDPIFFYEPRGTTFAHLTREEKAAVSHRGRALRPAAEYLTCLKANGILSRLNGRTEP